MLNHVLFVSCKTHSSNQVGLHGSMHTKIKTKCSLIKHATKLCIISNVLFYFHVAFLAIIYVTQSDKIGLIAEKYTCS